MAQPSMLSAHLNQRNYAGWASHAFRVAVPLATTAIARKRAPPRLPVDRMNPSLSWTASICFAGLLFITKSSPLNAGEPESFKVPTDSVAVELVRLATEYDRLAKLRQEAFKATPEGLDGGGKPADEKLSDEEWLKQGRQVDVKSVDPDVVMLPRFLELAKKNPLSPFAFDSLFFVIRRGGSQTGDVLGEPWRLKEEAIDVVWKYHANDPRLFILLEQLSGALPSNKTEALLKRAMDEGHDKRSQAAGAYNLAFYYATLARAHQRTQRINQKVHLLNFERFWKIVITPYLEKHFPIDEEYNSAEIDRLLRLVADEYADVPASDWKLSGPGKIFVELKPFPKPKTYGDLARAMIVRVEQHQPGQIGPRNRRHRRGWQSMSPQRLQRKGRPADLFGQLVWRLRQTSSHGAQGSRKVSRPPVCHARREPRCKSGYTQSRYRIGRNYLALLVGRNVRPDPRSLERKRHPAHHPARPQAHVPRHSNQPIHDAR